MKRLGTLALVVGFTAAPIFAEDQEGGSLQIWKWANFVVLAGGIGYLVGRSSPRGR